MKEFVEKLIGRLEEEADEHKKYWKEFGDEDSFGGMNASLKAIEIVNQLAEEYKTEREKVISKLLEGEWVDTEDVEMYLGVSLKLGLKLFDFSRTAEWNPPPLNGQKITTEFRLKTNNNGWIPCDKKLPKKSGKYLVTQERYSLDDRLCKRPIAIEVDYVDFNATDNSWSRARFFKVIAWQPLPELYQKGAGE